MKLKALLATKTLTLHTVCFPINQNTHFTEAKNHGSGTILGGGYGPIFTQRFGKSVKFCRKF